jgi:antitoxin component of MazEF toxin-antitoxin module
MTVTIKKLGGSMAVVIPKAVVKEMDLAAGASLDMTTANGAIVMRTRSACRQRRPIREIVAQIKPATYRRRNLELGQDGPVGKERW